MSNKELQSVIDYMEREKGLDRMVLVEAIKSSLQSAARKSVHGISNPEIEIDPETFEVSVHERYMVVEDSAVPGENELILSLAREKDPDVKPGDQISVEVTPKNFGRIAAQTAKQVIIQKLRDAQADVIYNEYKDKVFHVVTGIVRHNENRNVVVDLGRGEALLKYREQIDNEDYRIGDRLKLLIIEVRKVGQSPEILVSRSHPLFVKKLFEIEVPEIADGTVEVKGIAREAGYRTKIAVHSTDAKVDCVGACVGMRGSRVKNIVNELNGEKIDIVPWAPDVTTFCRNAMNPAKLKHVVEDPENNRLQVFVDQSQFSLSIGKRGHNARLTSKLLGWKIDIEVIEKDAEEKLSREMAAEKKAAAQEKPKDASEEIPVQDIAGLSNKVKEYLEEAGYNNLGELKKVQIDELYAIPGVGKSSADDIMDIIRNADKAVQPESKPEAGQESGQESASEADSNSTPEPAPEE